VAISFAWGQLCGLVDEDFQLCVKKMDAKTRWEHSEYCQPFRSCLPSVKKLGVTLFLDIVGFDVFRHELN
jgi:hypothetical protein